MYPLRVAEITERSSEIRIRSLSDDDDAPRQERATVPPPGRAPRPDPSASVGEILFRFQCGDFDGAMCAAEQLMLQIPVLVKAKEELRSEPLSYWQLQVLAHVDGDSMVCEILEEGEVPCAEAVRVVCELSERRIISLR
jgi:hypothetical protein